MWSVDLKAQSELLFAFATLITYDQNYVQNEENQPNGILFTLERQEER